VGGQPDLGPLERTARELAAEWDLELGEPFTLSRHSFVAPAGDDAVLKVVPADDDESDQEADALGLWEGDGAVRLLRHSRKRRALLIEGANPGTDLATLGEDEATAVAVEAGLRLWRSAGRPFRWIGDHVPGWLDGAEKSGASPPDLVELARELYRSLQPGRSTLIHGDFHHHNILDAGGRFVAIDPKPMLGEPEYDVPSFLWNPMQTRMELEITERRLAAFGDTGLDEERMRAWSVVRAAYLGVDPEDVEVILALRR
jgi:streptomycin 6-kinase